MSSMSYQAFLHFCSPSWESGMERPYQSILILWLRVGSVIGEDWKGGFKHRRKSREMFITLGYTCGASQVPKRSLFLLRSWSVIALSVFMFLNVLLPLSGLGVAIHTHTIV